MDYQKLLEQVREHVLNYYNTHGNVKLVYHNQQHIKQVVFAANEIANHCQLTDHDYFILMASLWFHDTGYLTNLKEHEEQSAILAEGFLTDHKFAPADIELVKNCIMATKMPQSAGSLLEEIVCDADLFHLGTDEFFKKDKLLLKEFNLLNDTVTSKLEWRKKSIIFLEKHSYYTAYCKLKLNDKQAENLQELRKKVQKLEEDELAGELAISENPDSTFEKKEAKKSKRGEDKPEKAVETMFKISSSNHQRLSDMADGKAHIMITVNSIILSAIISLVLRRLDTYGYLIIPSFVLLTVSLVAMTFAILSTRPSIPKGTFTPQQVEDKNVNLLFFGNFYKMPLTDFSNSMLKMMKDSDFLYGSLIRDLYAQGTVLGKKYHLLRIAYNVFMFGLIVSVVAFIFAFIFFNHPAAVVPAVPKAK